MLFVSHLRCGVCGMLLGLLVALSPNALAQLYSCKGEDGRTRYVSSIEQCPGKYTVVSKPQKKSKTKSKSGAKSPGKLPRVSNKKQSALDKKREKVLLYELRSERKARDAMDDAVAETAPEEKRLVKALQKQREEHARNIVAIRQELARLGVYVADSGN